MSTLAAECQGQQDFIGFAGYELLGAKRYVALSRMFQGGVDRIAAVIELMKTKRESALRSPALVNSYFLVAGVENSLERLCATPSFWPVTPRQIMPSLLKTLGCCLISWPIRIGSGNTGRST